MVGIPLVLAADFAGGWALGALIAVVASVAGVEFYGIMRSAGYRPAFLLGVACVIVIAVLPLSNPSPQNAWIFILLVLLALGGLWYLAPGGQTSALGGWLATVAGPVYVGLLLGHLSLLRTIPEGAWWVLVALVVTWAYDTGAYAAGTLIGRRPFMQHISPRKTLEGVAGGLILSSLTGLVAVPAVGLGGWQSVLLGLAGGLAAQTGDLFESMLKRQAGVKDAGAIVPGHGGLLDRIDGLLFVGALTYYVAAATGHA